MVLLIKSMLGLIPLAPCTTLIVDPELPEWLPELTLTNIQVGDARIGLRFRRDQSGYTHHEVIEQRGSCRSIVRALNRAAVPTASPGWCAR